MAAAGAEPSSNPAAGARFFCTAGRGLEPFLMREVQARLEATQVEYISGKVFFTTRSDLPSMKKLKSAERLFLLIRKQLPIAVPSQSKGKILTELQRLINEDPGSWLKAISLWRKLLEHDKKGEKVSQRDLNALKRKVGGNEIVIAKKLKLEEKQMVEESRGEGQRDRLPEDSLEQGDALSKTDQLQEHGLQNNMVKAADTQNQDLTFRVSCRCSGNIGKAFPPQEAGRVVGIALMRKFGWKANLRNPHLEVMNIHLDFYTTASSPFHTFQVGLTSAIKSMFTWIQQAVSLRQPRCRNVLPKLDYLATAEGDIYREVAEALRSLPVHNKYL